MKSVYRSKSLKAALAAAAALCQAHARAQTNAPPLAASTNAAPASASGTNVTELGSTTIVAHINEDVGSAVVPDLGATAFKVDQVQILSEAKGGNGGVNDIVLRAPGVAQDSAVNGDLHVRGEHANLQYRVDDVLLPESIGGFGLELDPRFIDSLQLITGALPAQYGYRTSGVIDIQTKSGIQNGGEVGIYGGSFDTYRPYFQYGGSKGKWSFFGDANYLHNDLGIENPTNTPTAIHDETEQYHAFIYSAYQIDDTSRLTFMGSADYSTYQIPDTDGLSYGANAAGTPYYTVIPGATSNSFASSQLNENQIEQNYFGVASYQQSSGDLDYQASLLGRASKVHFEPDQIGDLYFNGESSDVARSVYSGGAQFDASYQLGEKHKLRAGFMFLDEYVTENTTTGVFPTDTAGDLTGAPVEYKFDNNVLHGIFAGVYVSDEWKILPKVTLNYGARFDEFYSTGDKENQPSPRVNLVYQPTDETTLHIGYSRYFTPPPLEEIPVINVAQFNGTTGSTGNTENDPVKSERANYFDAGVTHKILPGWQGGIDGYYKSARNELDDGLFGQSQILDAFNYQQSLIYGVEFTSSYTKDGLSLYANVAYSVALGKDWNSAEFLFGADGPGTQLAYVRNNWVYLDHDQRVSGSFGASYLWQQAHSSTRFYVDALYGSGLRADGTAPDGTVTPNGASVPAYYSVNMGAEQTIQWSNKDHLKLRLDVINVTDNSYELRNGSGIGVNAAQYGQRLGFFGTVSYLF